MPFIWNKDGFLFVPTDTYEQAVNSQSGLALLFDDVADTIQIGNNTTQGSENLVTSASLLTFARENLIMQEPVVSQTVRNDLQVEGSFFANKVHALSDARFKSDITPSRAEESLEIVKKVKTYTYLLKNAKNAKNATKPSHGVLAQELQEVAPEAVTEQDGVFAVDYNQLVAMLIGSVQELARRVESLEKNYSSCCEK